MAHTFSAATTGKEATRANVTAECLKIVRNAC